MGDMPDEIDQIENNHQLQGLGNTALQIFRGAREAGASRAEALFSTAAVMLAMIHGPGTTDEEAE